ncbi:hypothetical protein MmiAt1_00740 [Methanimicrococcus sp. At1]|uniref:DUF116 domain-containing protein n=1 Tax=Methanimicrococcus hacksteinii TaxID=3028293 RepID=A0ABU3VMB5_9EURY|nr:DUF116 domain-containing protein [Methanimicrococcus sp. At1]MDV0444547.1 hypothetical protein [Methanimicrococcus sp. At1]
MLAVAVGLYSIRKKKIIYPKFVLFMLYLFYSPTKWVFSAFSMNDLLVDEILVEIQNSIYLEKFKKQDERKVILLPQCLRSSDCHARCDPLYGFICTKCGRCDIGEIQKEAEIRDFKVFVVPGSSFVKKIFKEYKPTSCIGVACPVELSESMQKTSVIPSQGVYLINDGCFETRVNVGEVVEKMDLVFPINADSSGDGSSGSGRYILPTLYDFENEGGGS